MVKRQFLADRPALGMIGYWHDNVSVCLSVCDTVNYG